MGKCKQRVEYDQNLPLVGDHVLPLLPCPFSSPSLNFTAHSDK